MLDHLADWYRVAVLVPKAEDIEKRRQTIKGLMKSDIRFCLDLVRCLYDKPTTTPDFLVTLAKAFQSDDAAFPLENNYVELRVLSGAILAHLIAKGTSKKATAAALTIASVGLGGHGTKPLLPAVEDCALKYLNEEGQCARAIPGSEEKTIAEKRDKFKEIATRMASLTDVTQIRNAAAESIGLLEAEVFESRTALRVMSEEMNVLWWLFSGYSLELDRPYSELARAWACFEAARDLAALTCASPGPRSAKAFLDKALSLAGTARQERITLKDAIADCPRERRVAWVSASPNAQSEDVCPLFLAVRKSVEIEGDQNAWAPTYEKMAGVKVGTALDPLALAFQAYQEMLSLRATAACK